MRRFYRDDITGEIHHESNAISPDDGPLLTAPSSAPDSEWFAASVAAVREVWAAGTQWRRSA